MRSKLTFLLFLALAPLFSYAQGCLTVFSEDGDRFYLVLNGIKQNPVAQTNVRIDMLPNEYYSAKILFEDQKKAPISKNIPVKDQNTGDFAEVTYKIKRTKDGELKMRFFGATPVPVVYNPPADMFIMHYGAPASTGTVTETTTTTTTTNGDGNGSISFGVSMGGGNININANDPNSTVQQTTTTTTSYSQTQSDYGGHQQPQVERYASECKYPVDWPTYKAAKATIVKATFEDTKLSTAKAILNSNCMSTDQVMDICRQFGFEATKLEFAKFAYAKTTDPTNYFKVAQVFSFDASKTDLNKYITANAR